MCILQQAFLSHDLTSVKKYGASGHISVYNLSTALDHNIWIQTGPPDHISIIAAGWRVDPGLNGDGVTRSFSDWTSAIGNREMVSAMVASTHYAEVNRALTPSHPITPVSRYGGPIYEIRIEVSQVTSVSFLREINNHSANENLNVILMIEPPLLSLSMSSQELTGNWWLRVHDPPISVGYWPKELFVNFRKGSLHAAWGGVAKEGTAGYCPPMGNGQMPDADTRKAAYLRNVRWVNAKRESLPPGGRIAEVVDTPGCYGVLDEKLKPDPWGYGFSFGGPGGYCRS
ncbi:uncharacterized protein LOC115678213 [Syzygium oleosum]|uniref:uncharacterized protein LOC115678213 n=1 Tax=Syzygium oleosum TaxID=219896 RepID=UPI0024B9E003|nr:uncharacterized protein LOC115678213 [Syzygium oleosum]